ncbi:MAG: hypothetical protein AAFN30_20250 [Actinomycetota bacterium]
MRWSDADIPLLDELLSLLGISTAGGDDGERTKERDEADEFEVAEDVDRRQEAIDAEQDDDDLEDDLAALDRLAEDADGDGGRPGANGWRRSPGGPYDTSVLDDRFDPPEPAEPDYFIELVEDLGDGWPGTGSEAGR